MKPPPRQSQPLDFDAGPIIVRQGRLGFALFLLGGLLFVFVPITYQREVSWPIWLLAMLAWYVPALAAVTVGIWGLLTQGIALTLDREGLRFGGFSFLKPHGLRWDEIVGVRHVQWRKRNDDGDLILLGLSSACAYPNPAMYCDAYRRELEKNLGPIEFANPLVLTYDGVELEDFARRLKYYLEHPTERDRLGSRRGSHAGMS